MSTRYGYKSEFMRGLAAEAEAEAEARAGAKAVLAIFAARGISVRDDARERITNCTDVDQLDEWMRRAAVATSVDEIFD